MPSTLDFTLGATLIGTLISSVLFGAVTVQFYIYWQSGHHDNIGTRVAVTVTWVVEFVWTVCIWVWVYQLTVTFYGHPSILNVEHWALALTSCANGLIGFIVQGYFAYRVRVLSGRWAIPLIALTGSLLQFSGDVVMAIIGRPISLEEFGEKYKWLATTVLVLDLSVDTLNTAAICFYLRIKRSAIANTNQVLNILFLWSIQSGILLSFTALVMLIFQFAMPQTGEN